MIKKELFEKVNTALQLPRDELDQDESNKHLIMETVHHLFRSMVDEPVPALDEIANTSVLGEKNIFHYGTNDQQNKLKNKLFIDAIQYLTNPDLEIRDSTEKFDKYISKSRGSVYQVMFNHDTFDMESKKLSKMVHLLDKDYGDTIYMSFPANVMSKYMFISMQQYKPPTDIKQNIEAKMSAFLQLKQKEFLWWLYDGRLRSTEHLEYREHLRYLFSKEEIEQSKKDEFEKSVGLPTQKLESLFSAFIILDDDVFIEFIGTFQKAEEIPISTIFTILATKSQEQMDNIIIDK